MKIALTGTAGRIGRAIHFNLCQSHDVEGLDRVPSSVTAHVGDVCDYEFLVRAMAGWSASRRYR